MSEAHVDPYFRLLDEEEGDEIGLVVRAHLLCESFLNEIVDWSLRRAKEYYKAELGSSFPGDISDGEVELKISFAQKANIAFRVGLLKKKERDQVLALNSLRNSASHKLDFRLSSESLKKFFHACLDGEPEELKQKQLAEIDKPQWLLLNLRNLVVDLVHRMSDASDYV